MQRLYDIIRPVLVAMPVSHLRSELIQAFSMHDRECREIEAGFARLTSQVQAAEDLRFFFKSWSQTNNSAMTVAGIGNRMTLLARARPAGLDIEALLQSMVSLGRIVDEDLAVTQKILHSEMFYQMATGIVGDDAWQSGRYLLPSAKAFKVWKDYNSLRDPDLMVALLTTLVHEIYTHGEVELILPLFTRWLCEDYGYSVDQVRRTLGWISVHCGPTERNHFFHAVDAIGHLSRALSIDVGSYALEPIVATYLDRKAAVIADLDHGGGAEQSRQAS